MTVRQIFPFLTNANDINLAFGDSLYCDDLNDPVVMAAFGDFTVKEIKLFPIEGAKVLHDQQVDVELMLSMQPIKGGA